MFRWILMKLATRGRVCFICLSLLSVSQRWYSGRASYFRSSGHGFDSQSGRNQSTQPSIPPGEGKSSTSLHWLGLRRGGFACVGWQVTLCDPIRQAKPCSSEIPLRTYTRALTFNYNFTVSLVVSGDVTAGWRRHGCASDVTGTAQTATWCRHEPRSQPSPHHSQHSCESSINHGLK